MLNSSGQQCGLLVLRARPFFLRRALRKRFWPARLADSSVTQNQARNCVLMIYESLLFALQQIILFISGVYTECFLCETK